MNLQGMTVAELIEALQGYPEDALVVFGCDYGDICHTEQALPVRELEELPASRIEETAYSKSGYEVARESEDDDEDEPAEPEVEGAVVVVLR